MQKGVVLALILLVLCASGVSALSVVTRDQGSVVIAELENPALYSFSFTSDRSDSIELFSLVGVTFSPRGTFDISAGTSTIQVQAFPNKELRSRPSSYNIEYQIKYTGGVYKDTLPIKIVALQDAVELHPQPLPLGSDTALITLTNVQNTNLQDVAFTFSSAFFTKQEVLSLQPYESKNISITLNKEKVAKLTAGPYVVTAEVSLGKAYTRIEGVLTYLEKQGTSISSESSGFLIRKTTTTKMNNGNTVVDDSVTVRRDIVSRLFTSFSLEPAQTKRSALFVTYTWNRQLQPGESWAVTTTTNYTLPFLFVLLVIVIVFFVKLAGRSHVAVAKKVSFVRTKGGEFALKVQLSVKARNHIDRLQLVDRLPGMTMLYEKYGTKPDRVDALTRRLFWDIPSLQAGEERVFSYIVYSKINVVGTFELPAATIVYEKEGKTHEALSNRAFFMNEATAEE